MALAKLSHAQATSINLARQHAGNDDRKQVKRELFAAVKQAYGIPANHKIKAETDNSVEGYAVVKNSNTNEPYVLDPNTGLWIGAEQPSRPVIPTAWFKLPADKLKAALAEAIDTVIGDQVERYDDLEDAGATAIRGGALDVALDADGNAYVLLVADHFD